VPCFDCVALPEIDGQEIDIYLMPNTGICGSAGLLTLSGSCQTIQCGTCGTVAVFPQYFSCAGQCSSCGAPASCPTTFAGYMLSPFIGSGQIPSAQ